LPAHRDQPLSIPSPGPQCLNFFSTPLVIERSPGQLFSDGGPLPNVRPAGSLSGVVVYYLAGRPGG